MPSYLLDTNVYDYILDNAVSAELVSRCGSVFITNVQISEIHNISNETRKEALLKLVHQIRPEKLQLRSEIWLDDLRWDDDQVWIDDVSDDCVQLLGNASRNIPWKDALIAEVAMHDGLFLVTRDQRFAARAVRSGVQCTSPETLFACARNA